MAKKRHQAKKAPRRESSCDRLAYAIQNFGSVMASMGDGQQFNGFSVLGPGDQFMFYKIRCLSDKKFGAGPCGSYEIEREGDVPVGLKKKDAVGNLHGLAHQVSRDFARMWDTKCTLSPTAGFQGARRTKRRR